MNEQKLSPRYFFVSIGLLVSLIVAITSFLNLVFETLNKKFPDVLNAVYQYGYNTYDYASIRSSLATLIIVFPVFLILSYFWVKFSQQSLGRVDLIIRKWMIYLIVFLSSVVIIVDLITLVRYFVEGEITTRFIWKVSITLFTAFLTGHYYMHELRQKYLKSVRWFTSILGIILIVGAIIWAFLIIGSPAQQRLLRLDQQRIQDLQNIQSQIIYYWQQKEKLPAQLSDLANPLSGYSVPIDPESEKGQNYEYAVKGPLTFQLCATFDLPLPKGWMEYSSPGRPIPMGEPASNVSYPYPGPGGTNESWYHSAGHACFERTIYKDLYPPNPKTTTKS